MNSDSSRKVAVAELMKEYCPFVRFMMIRPDFRCTTGTIPAPPEVWFYSEHPSLKITEFEQVLKTMVCLFPPGGCQPIHLNKADPGTRYRASGGYCLFLRDDSEMHYQEFIRKAGFDYRLISARKHRFGGLLFPESQDSITLITKGFPPKHPQ